MPAPAPSKTAGRDPRAAGPALVGRARRITTSAGPSRSWAVRRAGPRACFEIDATAMWVRPGRPHCSRGRVRAVADQSLIRPGRPRRNGSGPIAHARSGPDSRRNRPRRLRYEFSRASRLMSASAYLEPWQTGDCAAPARRPARTGRCAYVVLKRRPAATFRPRAPSPAPTRPQAQRLGQGFRALLRFEPLRLGREPLFDRTAREQRRSHRVRPLRGPLVGEPCLEGGGAAAPARVHVRSCRPPARGASSAQRRPPPGVARAARGRPERIRIPAPVRVRALLRQLPPAGECGPDRARRAADGSPRDRRRRASPYPRRPAGTRRPNGAADGGRARPPPTRPRTPARPWSGHGAFRDRDGWSARPAAAGRASARRSARARAAPSHPRSAAGSGSAHCRRGNRTAEEVADFLLGGARTQAPDVVSALASRSSASSCCWAY